MVKMKARLADGWRREARRRMWTMTTAVESPTKKSALPPANEYQKIGVESSSTAK